MRAEGRTVGSFERILHLKKSPAIGALASHELAVVAESTHERLFSKGSALLREGEPIHAVYFVVEGKVRVSRKGRQIGILGPGAGIGSVGILARDEHGLGAVAEEDTLTLELEADAFHDLLEDHFPIMRTVMAEICRQLVDAWSRAPDAVPLDMARNVATPPSGRDLDLVERIVFLRQGAFARSSINALAELSRGLTELRFEAGTTLWSEGEPGRYVMLVVSGEATCSSRSRGFLFHAGPGVPLGALEAVAETPRWYDAVAQTPLVVLGGDVEGLLDVFEDNFEMAMDYLTMISRWRIRILERLAQRGEDPLQQFYAPGQTT